MTTYDIFSDSAGVAAVAAEPNNDQQMPVSGVLFGVGDVANGLSGKPTRWTADSLETMADDGLFEGKPFTLADSLDPEQHVGVEMTDDGPMLTGSVSMDEKVGEITATEFDPDIGLLFEGFVADFEAEDAIQTGLAQVSPVVIREVELVEGEEGDPDAIYEPTNVAGARDVALVADGAVPSNEINVGPSPEIDSQTAEALTANFGFEVEALADVGDVQEGSRVRWGSQGSRPAYGRIEEVRGEGDAPLDDEIDGDQTIQPPAALIEIYRPTDDGWSASDTMVGHSLNTDTLTAIDEFPSPESLTESPGSYDGIGQSGPDTTDLKMDLTDNEQELVAAARQRDDPTVVSADRLDELEAQLEDHDDLIEEAAELDEPEVMDADKAEAMRDRVSMVEGMMAEALQDRNGLKESTVEAMSFDAMASEFEGDDGLDVEALTQSPESGSGPTGGDGGSGPSDEDCERIEQIDNKLDTVGNALPDERVEALRDEAAELAGADDYDGALEVL